VIGSSVLALESRRRERHTFCRVRPVGDFPWLDQCFELRSVLCSCWLGVGPCEIFAAYPQKFPSRTSLGRKLMITKRTNPGRPGKRPLNWRWRWFSLQCYSKALASVISHYVIVLSRDRDDKRSK